MQLNTQQAMSYIKLASILLK